MLVGWRPDDLLRPSRDLKDDAHLVSEDLEGLLRALGIPLTAVLTSAGFRVEARPGGWLRVTRPPAGASRLRTAGSSEGLDEGDGGGDAGGGGQEALRSRDGDAVAQDGWQGAGQDEPGAGAGGEQ